MFLGIDFGTSNSSAALMIDERPRLVKEPVKQGYSFPSSIYVTEEGKILVGQIAENIKFLDLTRYRREFKKDLLQSTPYFLGSQGEYEFTPQELITEVIKTLKKEADKITTSLGKDNVTDAVITIPASYKKNKQDLMKEAARKAGFTSVKLLEEPVAAAIYYNHQNPATFQAGDVILIYDLGGGTFDATLIKKDAKSFQILGQPVGIENCGGINFDRAIFENLKNFYNTKSQNGLNSLDKNQKNLLLDFCRDIKHQFSSYTNAAGQIPISGQTYQLAVSDFNHEIASYIEQTLDICENLIKSAGLEIQDISRVLMVGGSCRIPYIQESIEERLKTSVLLVDEPELAVCQGAAIYSENTVLYSANLSKSKVEDRLLVVEESVKKLEVKIEKIKPRIKVMQKIVQGLQKDVTRYKRNCANEVETKYIDFFSKLVNEFETDFDMPSVKGFRREEYEEYKDKLNCNLTAYKAYKLTQWHNISQKILSETIHNLQSLFDLEIADYQEQRDHIIEILSSREFNIQNSVELSTESNSLHETILIDTTIASLTTVGLTLTPVCWDILGSFTVAGAYPLWVNIWLHWRRKREVERFKSKMLSKLKQDFVELLEPKRLSFIRESVENNFYPFENITKQLNDNTTSLERFLNNL